ncbi:glucose-6-phosphate dehydrogenase [Peloplasma aerotolerans]|uniref:Glucose-6-phosphate dehydrogenase n=1 Tax=Peloplasma aerotolerans TaxID=3044389 RepID=A0AAW6UA55_9MOLU|nr:glucose-6-phosphate dehydrogenase [Mariniplasma sp. M4Ah]MDI6453063.1 glucose-6-phosphate dehydrogenase [Mariniplasma sp. M4Ah]
MIKKIITIFGSTGNLMYKKLFPALDALIKKGLINQDVKILCIARKDCTLEDYVEEAKKEVKENLDWDSIIPYLTYIKMDLFEMTDYIMLKDMIHAEGKDLDVMFYLAVPPTLFEPIAKGLSISKIMTKAQENRRILFEKPFGSDFEDAKHINQTLQELFDEKQIYRIDHYLGKEMIQNIFIMRFANSLFKHQWDNKRIKSITVLAKESETVMMRGGYYDGVGALKDMVQSHLLQMVSLITMNQPIENKSSAIKDSKVDILNKVEFDLNSSIFGQYDGYLDESGIQKDSNTETFVFLKAHINHKNWKGVPIYFLTGKKLNEKRSEIIIEFESDDINQKGWEFNNLDYNQLIIRIAPEEGVTLKMNVKTPGLNASIIPAELTYCHACQSVGNTPEAYEKLLLDLLNKDDTLYTRWDEIVASWQTIAKLKDKSHELVNYQSFEELKQLILETHVDVYKNI